MSMTRDGKGRRKRFDWTYDEKAQRIRIETEDDRIHEFSPEDIRSILAELRSKFGNRFFPLANDVENLGEGKEGWGLGRAILELSPGRVDSITRAQASSYLGVILEECGYFQWNGRDRGIEWRLIDSDFGPEALASRLRRK